MSQLFMRRPTLENLPEMPTLPDGLTIRAYQTGDEIALAALLRTAFGDETWTADRVRKSLVEPDDVKTIFVADGSGANGPVIAATASARLLPDGFPDAGYVHWVAAHPAFAGKRLGYAITLAVLQEFVRLGCHAAVLETDDHRLPAIRTYLQLGFLPAHRDDTHAARWTAIEQVLALPRP